MTIKEHIKRRRLEQRRTLDDVASQVGVSRQTIQKYESGVIANIPYDKVEALAHALGTTPAVLMGWQDEARETPFPEGTFPIRRKPVPLLGEIAAGEPIFAQEDYSAYTFCDDDLACDFALHVKGNSMEPLIFQGDIVFVRRQEDVADGQIAAVLIDDCATLKHVYHLPAHGGIQLVAHNAAYAPMLLTGEEASQVRILGLAVAYQRRLSTLHS